MKPPRSTTQLCEALAARGVEPTLTTEQAAVALNRAAQTLRKWAFRDNGPIRPVRIHRRLAWKVSDIQTLLKGERDGK